MEEASAHCEYVVGSIKRVKLSSGTHRQDRDRSGVAAASRGVPMLFSCKLGEKKWGRMNSIRVEKESSPNLLSNLLTMKTSLREI